MRQSYAVASDSVAKAAGMWGGMRNTPVAVKRAVLRYAAARCTVAVEKYKQWRDIDPVVDPERTSLQ